MTMICRTLRAAGWAGATVAGVLLCGTAGAADVTLKASHQWPGGKGDVRDEMVQMIAKEVAAADVGLDVRVYAGASLFKPNQQWDAMVDGQLDISAFPLDYASGKHPQFSATLMPGLVKNHEHARRLNDSPFMEDIKQIIDEAGVMVLSDAWLAGGFAAKDGCIVEPADALRQGDAGRGAGVRADAGGGRRLDQLDAELGDLYRPAAGRARCGQHQLRQLRLLPHLRAGRRA